MNENLIETVTEEALRGCVHLRVLDLSHNLLHEQGIATRAWTRLKYVHPANNVLQFLYQPQEGRLVLFWILNTFVIIFNV